MIPPIDHMTLVYLGAGLVVAAILGVVLGLVYPPAAQLGGRLVELVHRGQGQRRPCRYCFLGRAHLHDENVRLDGDDLVEVRCWVCRSCGLPQWTVVRTAVLKKAA